MSIGQIPSKPLPPERRGFLGNVLYWGENTILLPLVILAVLGSSALYFWLTGSQSEEDISAVVGWSLQLVPIALAASATGLIQFFLVGYRSNRPSPALADDIHDSCVTLFLFTLCLAVISGWFH